MRDEVFFFVFYFFLWMCISTFLGEYGVSIYYPKQRFYPAAWPYVTGGIVLLYIITVIKIRRNK